MRDHDDAVPRPAVTHALDPDFVRRLDTVGLDPAHPGDPAEAWRRLHERFGARATLLDRYALEAAHRRVRPEELNADDRRRLTLEVLTVRTPGREIVPGSQRTASDPIEVVAYDQRWPVRFAEWRARLHGALGDTAVRIEHIGSTAVPGLAAKPVIDIQVGVGDLEDEAKYVPAIEGLGVALRLREPGHRLFRPSGDRPRTMQIHVYRSGSAEERDHLLFRDFLRTHPDAREGYARMKREVAGRYRDDRIAYNEAKTGFILDAMERARAWAVGTGWSTSLPSIRPMEPRDAAAVARVHVRSWQAAYRRQLPDAFLDRLSAEIDQRTARWGGFIAEAGYREATLWVLADQCACLSLLRDRRLGRRRRCQDRAPWRGRPA